MHGIFNKYINEYSNWYNYINGNQIKYLRIKSKQKKDLQWRLWFHNADKSNRTEKPMDMALTCVETFCDGGGFYEVSLTQSTADVRVHRLQLYLLFHHVYRFWNNKVAFIVSLWLNITSTGCTSTLDKELLSLQLENKYF